MGFTRCSGSHPPFRDHHQTIRPNSHEANRRRSEPPSRSHRSEPFPTQPARTDQITTNPWFYLPTDMQAFHRFQFYLATERLARGGGNHWQTIMEEAPPPGGIAKAWQAINIAMRPSPVCRRPPPPSAVLSGHTEPIGVSLVRHVPDEFHPRRPPSPPPRPRPSSREPLQTRKAP